MMRLKDHDPVAEGKAVEGMRDLASLAAKAEAFFDAAMPLLPRLTAMLDKTEALIDKFEAKEVKYVP
jgi:hypothetical protein